MNGWFVARDGKAVSPFLDTEDDAERWLLKHQSMSNDWAKKYGGYSIECRSTGKDD